MEKPIIFLIQFKQVKCGTSDELFAHSLRVFQNFVVHLQDDFMLLDFVIHQLSLFCQTRRFSKDCIDFHSTVHEKSSWILGFWKEFYYIKINSEKMYKKEENSWTCFFLIGRSVALSNFLSVCLLIPQKLVVNYIKDYYIYDFALSMVRYVPIFKINHFYGEL